MFKKYKQSILFYNPDYSCTFFYRDELQKIGWMAKIIVPQDYPKNILYSSERIHTAPSSDGIKYFKYLFYFLRASLYYKYIVYYGRPRDFWGSKKKFLKPTSEPLLFLLKLLRKKIIYIPSGCRDEFTRQDFSQFDNGNVCGNCGFYDDCDEQSNIRNLYLVNKYADLVIGHGFTTPSIDKLKPIKWKSFDLETFNPNIQIPKNFLMPKSSTFRILHSTKLKGRDLNGKNIKGSGYIEAAVERLLSEGFDCELIRVMDESPANMKYIQVQADVIIDQLIYGQWGSTSLEGIVLGKPVICYFNTIWKENYMKSLNIEVWPFIEAGTNSIYDVLKYLLNNRFELNRYSELSLDFAQRYLDIKNNAKEFTQVLEKL
jgi:hypothetical protein